MRKQQRPRVLLQRPNFLHEDLRISVLRTRSHCQTPFFSSLLVEIDTNPERPDNPVSDFLGTAETSSEPAEESVTPAESPYAQPLVGTGSEGLDPVAYARRLAQEGQERSARIVYRLTRSELTPLVNSTLTELNTRAVPGEIPREETPGLAREFISEMEPLINPIEMFSLASTDKGWSPGVEIGLRFASNFITFSQPRRSGRSIRFAQGTPALLGWRLLILMGAKALADEEFDLLHIIMTEPLEVEDSNGRYSNRPLFRRRDLFWPEAFLGNADLGIRYIIGLWQSQPHLQTFFTTEEAYHFETAQFLMLVALAYSNDAEHERELYPGYRLFSQAQRAMASLCSRLDARGDFRESIAKVIGFQDGQSLLEGWTLLAARANSAQLGTEFFPGEGVRFLNPLDGTD